EGRRRRVLWTQLQLGDRVPYLWQQQVVGVSEDLHDTPRTSCVYVATYACYAVCVDLGRLLPFRRARSATMEAATPAACFSVDVPPEMQEAMTAGGTLERRISRAEALQVPAVMRARNLICGTLASLPHVVIDPQRREV